MTPDWITRLKRDVPDDIPDNRICNIQAGNLRALFREIENLQDRYDALKKVGASFINENKELKSRIEAGLRVFAEIKEICTLD